MKKVICFVISALVALSASSQIRIEAGTSIGGFRGTTGNYSETAGITAGAFYDFGFKSNPYEYLAIGLQYTENGYESSGMDGQVILGSASEATRLNAPVRQHQYHWKYSNHGCQYQ